MLIPGIWMQGASAQKNMFTENRDKQNIVIFLIKYNKK